jgi:hypothetical protein
MTKALSKKQEYSIAAQESQAMISMIERMVMDPQVDVEKLERLVALKERTDAARRRDEFYRALAACQAEMPQMYQNGVIDYGRGTKISYAKLEDIDAQIKPIYTRYGFSVRWTSRPVMDGKLIEVIGTFTCGGHSETSEMTGPPDKSGGKNEAQAGPSGCAYLKRHITKQFWNLVERGRDLDGAKAADMVPITDTEADDIHRRLTDCKANVDSFKKVFGIEKIADLRHGQLKEAIRQIELKEAKVKQGC